MFQEQSVPAKCLTTCFNLSTGYLITIASQMCACILWIKMPLFVIALLISPYAPHIKYVIIEMSALKFNINIFTRLWNTKRKKWL